MIADPDLVVYRMPDESRRSGDRELYSVAVLVLSLNAVPLIKWTSPWHPGPAPDVVNDPEEIRDLAAALARALGVTVRHRDMRVSAPAAVALRGAGVDVRTERSDE